ncbi:MAG: hypothetical protein Q4F67_05060 [Propionibacteriaceae bacterium]|nr:hypothetical protein [Propionibacteriaceae bacterium]
MTENSDHADPQESGEDRQPGHLGNDTSKMTLLETDLAEVARKDPQEGREPVPGVQEALRKLEEIEVDLEKRD